MRSAFTLLFALLSGVALAQTQPSDTLPAVNRSLERFVSRTGKIVLLTDYDIPDINLGLSGTIETKIRKVTVGGETAYFYMLEKDRQFTALNWSLDYEQLVEMMKAVSLLKAGFDEAMREKVLYKENRFSTNSGIRVGYMIEEGKPRWFLTTDRSIYTPRAKAPSTVFVSDIALLEKSLAEGKAKIDEFTRR